HYELRSEVHWAAADELLDLLGRSEPPADRLRRRLGDPLVPRPHGRWKAAGGRAFGRGLRQRPAPPQRDGGTLGRGYPTNGDELARTRQRSDLALFHRKRAPLGNQQLRHDRQIV